MPEEAFQNSTYVEMPRLSDPILALDAACRSPFAESVMHASICRHVAIHRFRTTTHGLQRLEHRQAFWDRHHWLDTVIKARAAQLTQHYASGVGTGTAPYPPPASRPDPKLLFASMMAHALSLCLCDIMAAALREGGKDADRELPTALAAFRQRALLAARGILTLSRALTQLSILKVYAPRACEPTFHLSLSLTAISRRICVTSVR